MPRVIIKEKHAKSLLDASEKISDEVLGRNFRISIKTAVIREYFSLDGLVERLLAEKKTPLPPTKIN